MQIKSDRLSELRQRLLRIKDLPEESLAPFLGSSPLIQGTLYTLRRKCAKPSCRCARGHLHATTVLTASVSGKTRLWTISQDHLPGIRSMAQAYRRFRRARAEFVKLYASRGAAITRLIDAIGRIRRKQPQ